MGKKLTTNHVYLNTDNSRYWQTYHLGFSWRTLAHMVDELMVTMLKFKYVFFMFIYNKQISCFITKLPACKYSANYTQRHQDKYYTANVNITIQNVTRRKCTLYCTLNNACIFFNHKVDDSVCELLSSHIGTLEDKPGWTFVSTDYSEWKFRGPVCRYLRPVCTPAITYCIDTCEAPGYNCEAFVIIAFNKVTTSSTIFEKDFKPADAVDGNPATPFVTKSEIEPWFMVDLATEYKVLFITILNRVDCCDDRLKYLTIRIGNHNEKDKESNEICVDKQDQNNIAEKQYFCEKGPMAGRYVFVIRTGLKTHLAFGDILIYSL